ncbi:3'(2'),5'-bisphosphate nucleotidase 1 isoform X12 [Pan troglodytes]|uniref:3'(2'),5'-bisphosphate nucleotidase 1 isoform X12 n=1 Tax=Pan troglodytes TaxID=9598 RepID=UPI0007DBA012|nr:3'(2'),5'-bisphosphate nucleotidase 1 isoform X10 [Pan troglodytes]
MPSFSRLIDSAKARYWTQRGTWVYDNALLLLLKCLWSNVVPECTMASSNTVLMRLVASAYSIAQKAGMIVRRVIAEGDLGIVEKTCATDLQTKADRLAQMSICSSLARKFPKLTIIGEEDLPSEEVDQELIEDSQWEEILKQPCPSQYSAIKEEDLVVWVDPLDGTKEYTEGLLDNVTVLIGIAYEGKAIAGVINQPYYNYEIIQLIEGKASAYVFASPGCKKWDTCAPEVILHAVGGKLTDIHGNVLQYHKDVKHMNSAGVLATLRNYDYYASRVPESIKNALVP